MEMKQIADAVEKFNETFHDFKDANNQRLEEVEKFGKALPETQAKVDAIDARMSELDALKDRLEKAEVKLDTPNFSKDGLNGKEAAHMDAFCNMLRSVKEGDKDFQAQAVAEYREKSMDVRIGVPTSGGHAVPEVISRQIEQKLLDISPVLQVVNVVPVGTSDYKELVDTRGHAGGWVGEAGSRSETDTSTLEQVAPTMGIVYSRPTATEESLQDVFFNVESWLVNSSVEEHEKLIGAAVISGDGSNKPTGFLNGTPTTVDDDGASPERPFGTLQYVPSGAAGALPAAGAGQPDFLVDLVHKLKAGYRSNAVFMMNKNTLGTVRKFRDADGQYYWQPSIQAGNPSMLMGYPVVEAEDMPAIAANTFPIAFGDFRSGYTFTIRAGTSITVDDNITTPGFVKFYVRRRVGGILRNDDAIKLVRAATS